MKIYRYGFLVLVFLVITSALNAAGITYTFANGQITGTSPKYYEFDIMVQGSVSGTKIGTCQAYFNYNSAGFGASIKTAGKVTVTKGSLINFAWYTIAVNDNSASTLSILMDYLFSGSDPSFGSDLPTTPTPWAHVKIEIADQGESAGLSFASGLMANQSFESDPVNQYSPITASDTDDSSLPVQMSNIEAESTVDGIVLTWETASEVNSVGFHIWRSNAEDGEYKRITMSLIPGQGNSSAGAVYSFTDRNYEGNATYYYRIEQVDADGGSEMFSAIEVTALFIPTEYALSQNYPNPFNPMTTFTYDVPEVSDVTIKVYSLLGKEVRTIYSKQQMPGRYTQTWDGTDNTGRKLASGVYFLRMQAGSFSILHKMTLIR